MKNTVVYSLVFLVALLLLGCTEQYALQTESFEDALVVEATITNEYKIQQIKLTRTYKLEANTPTLEEGALVYITDDAGMRYDFVFDGAVYLSTEPFGAQSGRQYRLNITTTEDRSYRSDIQTLTQVTPMQSVDADVMTLNGKRGVGLVVNSYDPTAQSKYYRYEYEETYKVIAPKWDNDRAIAGFDETGQPYIALIPRVGESKTCFGHKASDNIIQFSTNDLSEDRVEFPVRFIGQDNYIISYRYSILVRQYVQNLAAFNYFKTLKELSNAGGGILSQNQPGFFYGNVKSVENPGEKVIGFFEVSSVSSQRIFFNYADLFPGEALPPYFMNCDEREYKFCFISADPECKGAALISSISSNSLLYEFNSQEYYYMVPPPCGDCTTFASNIIPEFWID